MDAMQLGISDPEEVVQKTPGAKIRKGAAKVGCAKHQVVYTAQIEIFVTFVGTLLAINVYRLMLQVL